MKSRFSGRPGAASRFYEACFRCASMGLVEPTENGKSGARFHGRFEMQRLGIWLRNIALLAVLATFAFLFGQPRGTRNGSGGGPNVVAVVNGEDVSRDVFEFFREQNQETF